jgi:hypothetical protein
VGRARGHAPSRRRSSSRDGRADAPQILNTLGIGLLGPALIHHGSEEQRRRFIPPMLSADEIWCQGFSEPGAGSDLASLKTSAALDGDHFVLNGQKVWTTFGPWADWIFVLARTDPEGSLRRHLVHSGEARHAGRHRAPTPPRSPARASSARCSSRTCARRARTWSGTSAKAGASP